MSRSLDSRLVIAERPWSIRTVLSSPAPPWDSARAFHRLMARGRITAAEDVRETTRRSNELKPRVRRIGLNPANSRSPENRVAGEPRASATQRAPRGWMLIGGHESEPTVGARFFQDRALFRAVRVIAVGFLVHHVARPVPDVSYANAPVSSSRAAPSSQTPWLRTVIVASATSAPPNPRSGFGASA